MSMALDPADYDVVGLRELAHPERRRSGRRASSSAGRSDSQLGDLAEPDRRSAWLGSNEERHKPYLQQIPRERSLREALREWLERLVARIGPGGTADALGHYERLGWITESVEAELLSTLPDPDRFTGVGGSVDDLTRADHVRSLAVISLAQLGVEEERPDDERPPTASVTTARSRSRPRSRSRSRERTAAPPRGRSP